METIRILADVLRMLVHWMTSQTAAVVMRLLGWGMVAATCYLLGNHWLPDHFERVHDGYMEVVEFNAKQMIEHRESCKIMLEHLQALQDARVELIVEGFREDRVSMRQMVEEIRKANRRGT